MPTVFIIGTVSGGAEVQGLTTFGHHSERKHFQPSEPCASALVGNADPTMLASAAGYMHSDASRWVQPQPLSPQPLNYPH